MHIQAELISIGNELLSGQTLNTHGRDLGAALSDIGLSLTRDTTIGDDIPTIETAVKEALERVDLVFVSGGLGPTIDDITRDALAELLQRKIILDSATVKKIERSLEDKGRKMSLAATRQAQVLEGADVLNNSVGHAPGQRIETAEGKILFVLPGPPNEFNAILNEEILPRLKIRYSDIKPLVVRFIRTQGIGESDIVTILEKAKFQPPEVDLGFYPGQGRVKIRLSSTADHEDRVLAAVAELQTLLADFIFSE
ncbi:competence/damage-inducible protein A [Verrucomicrobia bacterium S94]|nr:competence/damage-inducible protein A [Verrucomicrobia bacterium S94]